jgi:hypothetical protein
MKGSLNYLFTLNFTVVGKYCRDSLQGGQKLETTPIPGVQRLGTRTS